MTNIVYSDTTPTAILQLPSGVITRDDILNIENIKEIIFDNNIVEIGESIFVNCHQLDTVVLPTNNEFTTLKEHTFRNCKALQSIVIPDNVTTIEGNVFQGCTSLTNIVFPDNSEFSSIGYASFYNCDSLKSIVIPDTVTNIAGSAFNRCDLLESVTLPSNENFNTISGQIFHDCDSLKNVIIPGTVTSIESKAFEGCTSITTISIPDSVESMGSSVFKECSTLSSITLSTNPNFTSLSSSTFRECTSLESIIIPENVQSLSSNTFDTCSSLNTIVVPSDVTFSGTNIFKDISSNNVVYAFDSNTDTFYKGSTTSNSIIVSDEVATLTELSQSNLNYESLANSNYDIPIKDAIFSGFISGTEGLSDLGISAYDLYTTHGLTIEEIQDIGFNVASTSGDPHVFPLYGDSYELSQTPTQYRMLEGEGLLINASTREISNKEKTKIKKYFTIKGLSENTCDNHVLVDGVFYDKVYLKSEEYGFMYEFDEHRVKFDNKESENYFRFNMKKEPNKNGMNKYEACEVIVKLTVTFKHTLHGTCVLELNYFSNPQIKYGISIQLPIESQTTFSGLFIREYEEKSMRVNHIYDTRPVKNLLRKNKHYSKLMLI